MNILWITNILFPDICNKLGIKTPVTGGWMKSSAQALLSINENISLAVATLHGNTYRKDIINGVTYYCLPFNIYKNKYDVQMEEYWKKVAADFNPDIVHIHGTEFPHGLAYMRGVRTGNVVISIQGLVGAYARYSLGQIPIAELRKYQTTYDILRGHLLKTPESMAESGEVENEYLRLTSHVIGRTDWDRDHVWAVNPNAKYHFCNETLRSPFYTTRWNIDGCEPHSIFLSQAHKPIKGIHKMVEAMPYILREFPDAKVYVAGGDFTQKMTIKDRLRFGTYANYVLHLMDKLNVRKHFVFTGLLDEQQMADRYKASNVFVCPSSIENSPNSLGEAQLVGTPVVASYVGGVPNMIEHGKTGLLYRFEEHEMLAQCVCSIFRNNELAIQLSQKERESALNRHDKKTNALRTIEIYNEILSQ